MAGLPGTVAAGGRSGQEGTPSGDGNDDALDAPEDYPVVTTRDHFEVTWYGSVSLADGHTETVYDVDGDWPSAGAELTLFVHGWLNDGESGRDSAHTAEVALREADYDDPVVGYVWDADEYVWWTATEIAERNGAKLANFTTDYLADHPDASVRYVAHSLGARVVLRALATLHEWGRADAVESVSLLGGAADDDAVAADGEYGDDVEYAAGAVHNYWKDDDAVLQWAYSLAEADAAVGEEGCEGTTPANYEDHNVDDVPDHFSYPEPGEGCVDDVVADF